MIGISPFRHIRAALCAVLSLGALCVAGAASGADVEATVTDAAPPLRALQLQARAYEHGEGVKKDINRALALYCDGARAGDPEAQFSLGWMHANGRGVVRQDSVAAYFFMLAAEQGHQEAVKMLRYVGDPGNEVPGCLKPRQAAERLAVPARRAEIDLALEEFVPATPAQKNALQIVNDLAPKFGVAPRLALAIIRAESNFDPSARSPKNAQGLMQLIPETSVRFNVTKPYDPAQNVRGGLAYLRWLLAYFEGDVELVAAAYNAGEGVVNRYRGIPPYPETRTYVKRIISFFGRRAHPYDPAVTEPSPEFSRPVPQASQVRPGTITAVSLSVPRER